MVFGLFGGDEPEEDDGERLDADRREEIDEILEKYEQRFEGMETEPRGRVESREYQEYKAAEREHQERTLYEKLVGRVAFFEFTFSDMEDEHRKALDLLQYDVTPGQVAPTALVMMLAVTLPLLPLIVPGLLAVPALFRVLAIAVPPSLFYYLLKYPSLKARQRVVQSSEDIILAVLYMVIYMRSSPTMEGALSFAARHLDGPVATDFKQILWRLDMRRYNSISEGMTEYMARWRPYNKAFVEALSLIMSSTQEANEQKRNEILTEAIHNLLDFTRQQMDEFAKNLRIPVMVLYGIGILLPVLGVILFPLVATFMGGGMTVYYIVLLYNVLIPVGVLIFMRNLLIGRPLSLSSRTGRLETAPPGQIRLSIGDHAVTVSAFAVSIPLFLLLMAWPAPHFYQILVGSASFPLDPSPLTLLREVMPVAAVSLAAGVHLVAGYRDVVEKQVEVRHMEQEFPEALFELGNALDRGQPIELAVSEIERSHKNLSISDFFAQIADNLRKYGMTFEEAVFDSERGAIRRYPSKLIRTVMKVIAKSTQKGTGVAAQSMQTISQYLKNIHKTQEQLEDAVSDTLSSLTFLGYVLAPVIAGVAVGMGSVISLSLYSLSQNAASAQVNQSVQGGPGLIGGGGSLLGGVLDVDKMISPGIMQLIVAVYLIQISLLVGTLMVRVKEGPNSAKQRVTIGKMLLSSTTLYVITVLLLVVIFGGIIQGALQGAAL